MLPRYAVRGPLSTVSRARCSVRGLQLPSSSHGRRGADLAEGVQPAAAALRAAPVLAGPAVIADDCRAPSLMEQPAVLEDALQVGVAQCAEGAAGQMVVAAARLV